MGAVRTAPFPTFGGHTHTHHRASARDKCGSLDGARVGWVCLTRGQGPHTREHRHSGLGVSTLLRSLVARFSGMSAFTRASSG